MSKQKINWYRLNRQLHRDIGYFCLGFVLIYAISGIAINHKDDWNPNYIVERHEILLNQQDWDLNHEAQLAKQVIAHLPSLLLKNSIEPAQIKATYWEHANSFKIFLTSGENLQLKPKTNSLIYEQIKTRPVFNQLNRLHLNETQRAWIFVSDIFAACLIFLAISALFMVKGKHSPRGKKSLLVLAGFFIPAGFIFL